MCLESKLRRKIFNFFFYDKQKKKMYSQKENRGEYLGERGRAEEREKN